MPTAADGRGQPDGTGHLPVRRELRLAVAMNGGVSLAVWIGGVASELERFRLASGTSPWAEARRRLGIERVVVDVLAGSSAGGLNAAFLALAQAFEDVSLDELREVWFELADFDTDLLRGRGEPKLRTPLDGEYFLHQLRARIAAMIDGRASSHLAVDLRVTATSLRGEREDFPDLIGAHFVNSNHEVSFRFRTDPSGRAGDFADTTAEGSLVRNLALAGRASASFPVAFEPVLVDPADFGPDGAGLVDGVDTLRFLVDGGVLNNLPVDRAVEAIFYQPADAPVNRVLLAVIPLHQERRTGDRQSLPDDPADPYSTFSVGFAAGVTIPRNETSAAGLHELERLNRDSTLLVTSRRALFDLPFGQLVHTGEGLWTVYVRQQMVMTAAGAGSGAGDPPPWLPADPWVAGSRRAGSAVRRAAAIVLDLLTRVVDGAGPDAPEEMPALRRRVYDCIDRAALLDPYDPDDPQLGPTRAELFAVREDGDMAGGDLDIGSELGAVFTDLASVVADVARFAATIDGLRSLRFVPDDADGSSGSAVPAAFRWLTAVEIAQGALGPSINPQSTVHSAIVSPARAARIDPRRRVDPATKLAGDDLGHFGAFLKRSWRANDWLWGRLDAASALGAITARLGLPTEDVDRIVLAAQAEVVREEAPSVVRAIVHDLEHGARSPHGCALVNGGKPTRPPKAKLDRLGPDVTWDVLVSELELGTDQPEQEFLRRLEIGRETVKDELRSPLLVRVGTRFASAMTRTALGAQFPSLIQRFLAIFLLPLRGITSAATRFTADSRQPWLGLIAVALFVAGAADVLDLFDLGSFAVLVWPAAAALALLRLAKAPVTTLIFAIAICGVGLAYVLVDSDRWAPPSPYDAWLQNRLFVIAALALLWIVMGLREVQRIDDVVARVGRR